MVMGDLVREVDVAVVGGGPGGYTAAFRCAELGLETVVVDAAKRLGGACLFEGCIPSKALLHVAAVLGEAERAKEFGVDFGEARVSLDPLRKWKSERVIGKLARGLAGVAKAKNVDVVAGRAVFEESRGLRVEGDEPQVVVFKHAIIATGSAPSPLPGLTLASDRIMDSTAALEVPDIPDRLLVVGGGYIGLELGQVYAALGSKVTLVEMTDGLLPGVDRDLVQPLARRCEKLFAEIRLQTKVTGLRETSGGVEVRLGDETLLFDRVLVAVGRRAQTQGLGLETTRVRANERGIIAVDDRCRTDDQRIYAVGDVTGEPMLAHRAMRQGRIAAEAIAGPPGDLVALMPRATPPAVLDLRERAAYERGHIFRTTSLPRRLLEFRLPVLVTAAATPIVLVDDDGRLAALAAPTLAALGYRDVRTLAGGLAAWRAAGLPTVQGINVPSKVFGERALHQAKTPQISAPELAARIARGVEMVIVDSRTFEEYARGCVPGAISVPGGELVLRIGDLVSRPDTPIVVHCGGRTRSYIGAESLRRMRLPNPVVALENGTMGWELAGLTLERGAARWAPAPSARSRAVATLTAKRVAAEDGLAFISPDDLAMRLARRERDSNLYVLDVRTADEYAAGHVAGAVWAPGGQAVQATDEYVAVRAAATLDRLGYTAVSVLEGGTRAWADAGLAVEDGRTRLADEPDDVVLKPYERGREAMERYLRWEADLDQDGRSRSRLL